MKITRNLPTELISCPHCATPFDASDWIECDGDIVPISNEGRGALLWNCNLYSFRNGNGEREQVRPCAPGRFEWDTNAWGGSLDCCANEIFFVQVKLAAAKHFQNLDAQAADDWINKYFWENEPITDPCTTYALKRNAPSRNLLPRQWLVDQIDLPEGRIHAHDFGPFQSRSPVLVDGEMHMCRGSAFWDIARELVLDAWPVLVKLSRFNFDEYAVD